MSVLSLSKESCYFWGFQFYFREFTETPPGLLELASPPCPFYRWGVPEAPECQSSEWQRELHTRGMWAGRRDLPIQLEEVLCFPLAPCALRMEGRLSFQHFKVA